MDEYCAECAGVAALSVTPSTPTTHMAQFVTVSPELQELLETEPSWEFDIAKLEKMTSGRLDLFCLQASVMLLYDCDHSRAGLWYTSA